MELDTYRITYFSRVYSFENQWMNQRKSSKAGVFFFLFFFLFIKFESSFPQCGHSIFNENPFPLKIHRRTAKIDWFSLF